jgi:hypothetical protein
MIRRALAGALGVACLAACGFPDVTFSSTSVLAEGGPATDAAGGEPGGDGSEEAASSEAAPLDAPGDVAPEAASHDASVDAPPSCDEDGDGYLAMTAACHGTDCCDTDRNANPGQKQFFTTADACGSFDYDCDGQLETEYGANLTCTGTGLTGCKGGPGFIGDPACGTMGPWAAGCQGSGVLACQPAATTSQVQGCR